MKTKGRPWQFAVLTVLIAAFAFTAFAGIATRYGDITTTWLKGVRDIRCGVSLGGGTEVVYAPEEGAEPTAGQLQAARSTLLRRLERRDAADSVVTVDESTGRITARVPQWALGDDSEQALAQLGSTAALTFREGDETDDDGLPTGEVLLDNSGVESVTAQFNLDSSSLQYGQYYLDIRLTDEGKAKLAEETERLSQEGEDGEQGTLTIWLDDELLSSSTVSEPFTGGELAVTLGLSGAEGREEARRIADLIDCGPMEIALSPESSAQAAPVLGAGALRGAALAGAAALAAVMLVLIVRYRLLGVCAAVALLGQAAAVVAFVSGYFSVFDGTSLTVPALAGCVLALALGTATATLAAERTKEALAEGKALDFALQTGAARALRPVLDASAVLALTAVAALLAFGDTGAGMLASLGVDAAEGGALYAFGYVLAAGVAANLVCNVLLARGLVRGLAGCKALHTERIFIGKSAQDKPRDGFAACANLKKCALVSVVVLVALAAFAAVAGFAPDAQLTAPAGFARCAAAAALALALVWVYAALRMRAFSGPRAAFACALAMAHDALITLGACALLGVPMGPAAMAAALFAMGYGACGTLEVFGEIRTGVQMQAERRTVNCRTLADKSVGRALRGRVGVCAALVLALACACAVCAALGLLQLAMTAVALIVGVVCATYSPLCIAAPVWGVWAKRAADKPAARAKAA